MRTAERLFVAIVGITLAAGAAAQTQLPQPPEQLNMGQLYPPAAGIHPYFGPTLEPSNIVLVVRLGNQRPVTLVLEALETPYRPVLPAGSSCVVLSRSQGGLVGPCFTQTEVDEANIQNITLLIVAATFPQQVTAGYYSVIFGQPQTVTSQCGRQLALYVNSTKMLQTITGSCVSVELVQAKYVWVGDTHG